MQIFQPVPRFFQGHIVPNLRADLYGRGVCSCRNIGELDLDLGERTFADIPVNTSAAMPTVARAWVMQPIITRVRLISFGSGDVY